MNSNSYPLPIVRDYKGVNEEEFNTNLQLYRDKLFLHETEEWFIDDTTYYLFEDKVLFDSKDLDKYLHGKITN